MGKSNTKHNTRKLKVIAKLAKMECELFKSNEQYPSLVLRCRSGALNIFTKQKQKLSRKTKNQKPKTKNQKTKKPNTKCCDAAQDVQNKPNKRTNRFIEERWREEDAEKAPSEEQTNNLHVHILHRNPKLMLMLWTNLLLMQQKVQHLFTACSK